MKISIITVVLNGAGTIERTLQSVISQKKQKNFDMEYIVIDGGSTDQTINIVNKYREHIDVFISENDKGIYDAMNKGIFYSTGDVIGFINSDDWYEDNALEQVGNRFLKEKCDIVYGNSYHYDIDGNQRYVDVSNRRLEEVRIGMIITHPTIFAKRRHFKTNDNFDIRYKLAADYNWFLGELKKNPIVSYVDLPLVHFSDTGISSTRACEGFVEARTIALDHCEKADESTKKQICNAYRNIFIHSENQREVVHEFLRKELSLVIDVRQEYYLCGAGTRGLRCKRWFEKAGVKIAGFCDKNIRIQGQVIEGIKVYSYEEIVNKGSGYFIVTSSKYKDEIIKELQCAGLEDMDCVFSIDSIEQGIVETV